MNYPTYQDLAEALHTPEFISELVKRTLPESGFMDTPAPWSLSHIMRLQSELQPAIDWTKHAVFTILGSNVYALASVDTTYSQALSRNPNIRDGIGAFTLFGTHVLSLAQGPNDRLTVVTVTMNEEGRPTIVASASMTVACRVVSLIDEDSLVRLIAQHAHEINRQYCLSIGDSSQVAWQDAPDWQKDSAINGVRMHLANPDATPEDSHKSWYAQKEAEGWVYGQVKDPEAKTHPCMVPYNELPQSQRAKDYLFRSMVHQLAELLKPLTLSDA